MAAPRRHAYLPGLAAFDENHSTAALKEIGFAGPGNHAPGTLFVDNQEAHDALTARMQVRHTQVLDKLLAGNLAAPKKAALQAEYRLLRDTMNNVRVVGQAAVGGGGGVGPADILFVKGHGSPRNPDAISTEVAPVHVGLQMPQGVFPNPTDIQVKRGFKMKHSAQEIARAVHSIAGNSLRTPALDVRITSCGSGGTASRDSVNIHQPDLTQTFAGQVSRHLDYLYSPQGVQVSGFQGDVNSTFPSQHMGGSGFVTRIRQKDDTDLAFTNAVERQAAKVGQANLNERMEPVKRPLRDVEVGNILKQQHPMPAIGALGPVNARMQPRLKPFTKITAADTVDTRRAALVPRDEAIVPIPRR